MIVLPEYVPPVTNVFEPEGTLTSITFTSPTVVTVVFVPPESVLKLKVVPVLFIKRFPEPEPTLLTPSTFVDKAVAVLPVYVLNDVILTSKETSTQILWNKIRKLKYEN